MDSDTEDAPSPLKKQRLSSSYSEEFGITEYLKTGTLADPMRDDQMCHQQQSLASSNETQKYTQDIMDLDADLCANDIEANGDFQTSTIASYKVSSELSDNMNNDKKEQLINNNSINNKDHTSLYDKSITILSWTALEGTDIEDDGVSKEVKSLTKPDLRKISSLVRDAKIISSVIPDADYNVIYEELLENRKSEKRLDIVSSKLLERKLSSGPSHQVVNHDVKDFDAVIKNVPSADANLVRAYLESLKNEPDRVKKTIQAIQSDKGNENAGTSKTDKLSCMKKHCSVLDDAELTKDPVFKDMRIIAKVFPDSDRNEIYALLEANVGKGNRVQIVMNELLHNEQKKAAGEDPTVSLPSQAFSDNTPTKNASPLNEKGDALQDDIEHLKVLVPDCDPNYLYEKLETLKDVPNRLQTLAEELTEKRDYPKLKERLEKERLQQEKLKKSKRTFTEEEFLKKFPDPHSSFNDDNKTVSDAYITHARVSIVNDFPMMRKKYLLKCLEENNYHFYQAFKKISDRLVTIPIADRKKHHLFMRKKRRHQEPVPTEIDEYFFHEYWFTHNDLKIEDFHQQKELVHNLRVQEARERGELYECGCCFDDECLFEDLANCAEGHLFCKTCIVRSTEAAFGEMKTRFPCLAGDCNHDIPLSVLQEIVSANLFSKIISRIQEQEVLQADISDLVTCPFCPFATIMPNPEDKVLNCLNPECLKESCRLCQEESHIPLKCNEVESRAGTRMRTYIENKVAEAVMRKCHKCGKRFLKDSGCNKMICPCGATSCYFCKAEDIDYNHFNSNAKCAQTDPNVIHERDMKDAAHKALQEYLSEHPDATELDLKSDLKDIIQNYNNSQSDETYHEDSDVDSETPSDSETNSD